MTHMAALSAAPAQPASGGPAVALLFPCNCSAGQGSSGLSIRKVRGKQSNKPELRTSSGELRADLT